jgi:hypothetical protein
MPMASRAGSNTRTWLSTFLIVAGIGICWSLAAPKFWGPDESAHAIRAYSVSHGVLTGTTPTDPDVIGLIVESPQKLVEEPDCAARGSNRTVDCAAHDSDTTPSPTATTAGRHPPIYYAIVGLPTWVSLDGPTLMIMRVLSALLSAAFIASAMVTARRPGWSRWLPVGIVLSCTPMTFYLFGLVGPNGLEIAVAIGAWVNGLVLVGEKTFDRRVLARFAAAATFLVLTRQLGLLWLTIVVASLVLVAGKELFGRMVKDRSTWIVTGIVAGASLIQAAWLMIVKPLDTARTNSTPVDMSGAQALRAEVGRIGLHTQEWIGVFGWADSLSAIIYAGWLVVLGSFAVGAMWRSRWQVVVVIVGLIAIVIALPFVLEVPSLGTAGYFWQGKYELPVLAGIPLVAAFELSRRAVRRTASLNVVLIGAAVVVFAVQVLAFRHLIRLHSDLSNDAPWYTTHPSWSLPFSGNGLTAVYAVLIGLWLWNARPKGVEV